MPGVRKKVLPDGKYQGWYTDRKGRRAFFSGTHNRVETLSMAQRLHDDHKQVRLGYRPKPDAATEHRNRPCEEVIQEYIDWGESQGGRGGRPWSKRHADKKKRYLVWWQERLGLEVMDDFEGVLPLAERSLRQLQKEGKSGKTLTNRAGALISFCNWCIKRGFLNENPLRHLESFDKTPQSERRALTLEQVKKLIEVAPEHRALLYETAFSSGLRAGELRALTTKHLDRKHGGLRLDAAWTKNRKPGFQPLPAALVEKLSAFARTSKARQLYERHLGRKDSKTGKPEIPLLFVPTHPSREMDKDLEATGIPKYSLGGKVDFHALRVAYITQLFEVGASPVEAQHLARHSDPRLTLNVYAKTRETNLAKLVEKVVGNDISTENRALFVHDKPKKDGEIRHKLKARMD